MARMLEAEWLGAHHDNGIMSRYDIVCVHTIVGYAPANAAHFSTRWDGHIYQSRDTYYRSAANYQGNYRVIAIENEDRGPAFGNWDINDGHAVPGFTAQQKEAIANILVWCHQTHGIPLVLATDSTPNSRGIAYHRQGIDGNFLGGGYAYGGRITGGEVWTTSPGKVCPGDNRITQLINEIIPRARQLAGLEDDMFEQSDRDALTDDGWRTFYANRGFEKIPAETGVPQRLVGEKIEANIVAADTSWRTYAILQGWTVIPQQAGIPERLWNKPVPVNQKIESLEDKVDDLTAKLDEVLGLLRPQE